MIVILLIAGTLAIITTAFAQTATDFRPLYEAGQWEPDTVATIGKGTSSERTDEGLLISDDSSEPGSMRCYMLNWQADPQKGAALEARVKVVSCTRRFAVCMMVADGVHEEFLSLLDDRILLHNCGLEAMMDTTGAFHDYRIEIHGTDIRVYVDGELTIDGTEKYTTASIAATPRNQCSFGAVSSNDQGSATWQWVRFRADKPTRDLPQPPQMEGLEVSVGETVPISEGTIYRSLFQFADGRLGVGDRLSADGGLTWTQGPGVGTAGFEFADGEIIMPGFSTGKVSDGVFSLPLRRSTDGGKTFVAEEAALTIPEATGGTGDDGKPYEGPAFDHSIVQLSDGSLLGAMYGYFKTDTVLCPTFDPEWKLYKYRTIVVRSTDRGKTWDYRATVAYDPEVGLESFCEADLLVLPEGEVLCFMRTGGSGGRYTPLYLARSADDGKTWSKPEPIADRGVWPSACRMESGVLVVTYGRPDNWLAFSLDEGRTWQGHFCFYQGPTTSYNSLAEIAPGRLIVVYDRASLGPDGNQQRGTVGTFFTVTRR